MKKKNVLMMALSLCMVAVIAVGGTLAYLTDSDGTLTNTFTFAKNIVVEQTETWQDSDRVWNETATAKGGDTGYSYTNLVAGQQAHKQPVVTVTTDIPTYVFIEVVNSDKVSIVKNDTYNKGLGAWNKNTDVPEGEEALPANTYYLEVNETTTWNLFDTIQFAEDATTDNVGSIVIKVKAIQKANDLETVMEAYEAVDYPTAQG